MLIIFITSHSRNFIVSWVPFITHLLGTKIHAQFSGKCLHFRVHSTNRNQVNAIFSSRGDYFGHTYAIV